MVKMTKIAMKILYAVIIMSMLVSAITPVFAATNPGDFATGVTASSDLDAPMKKIMGFVQGIGIGVAVIILVVIGIKYMMGSAEEKAEYKKTMIPYIVGAVLIAAAGTIANAIYSFGTGMGGTATK